MSSDDQGISRPFSEGIAVCERPRMPVALSRNWTQLMHSRRP